MKIQNYAIRDIPSSLAYWSISMLKHSDFINYPWNLSLVKQQRFDTQKKMQISADCYAAWFLERYVEPLRCNKMERILAPSSSRCLLPFFNRSRLRRHAAWVALRFSLWYFPRLFNIDLELPRVIEIFKITRIWGALTLWRIDNLQTTVPALMSQWFSNIKNLYYVSIMITLGSDPVSIFIKFRRNNFIFYSHHTYNNLSMCGMSASVIRQNLIDMNIHYQRFFFSFSSYISICLRETLIITRASRTSRGHIFGARRFCFVNTAHEDQTRTSM